ncbi:TPA: hypothetical protein ACKP22_002673 [Pseudomonas putida]
MMFLTFPWSKFFKRFFPIKALGILLTMVTIPIACGLITDIYLHKHPNYLECIVAMLGLCGVVQGSAQYSVIRGKTGATWWLVGMLAMCLIASGRGYFEPGMKLISLTGMLCAASALACYNSRRYRQMCKRLQVIRRMREEWIAYEKSHR